MHQRFGATGKDPREGVQGETSPPAHPTNMGAWKSTPTTSMQKLILISIPINGKQINRCGATKNKLLKSQGGHRTAAAAAAAAAAKQTTTTDQV